MHVIKTFLFFIQKLACRTRPTYFKFRIISLKAILMTVIFIIFLSGEMAMLKLLTTPTLFQK